MFFMAVFIGKFGNKRVFFEIVLVLVGAMKDLMVEMESLPKAAILNPLSLKP